jgi:hypothetical protein
MQRLGILSEEILRIMQGDTPKQDARYDLALAFLKNGQLPGDGRWREGAPRLIVQIGDADATQVQRIRQEPVGEARERTVRFDVRFRVAPSRAGGAGIGVVDSTATQTFVARVVDEPGHEMAVLKQFALAMRAVAEERLEDLRVSVESTFRKDALWRIVGWHQRQAWEGMDMNVSRLALEDPVIEKSRGSGWLARRMEVWIPFIVDVGATLRKRV